MKDGRYWPKPTNNNNQFKNNIFHGKKEQWTCIQEAVALEKPNKYKSLLSFQDKNEGIFPHFFLPVLPVKASIAVFLSDH